MSFPTLGSSQARARLLQGHSAAAHIGERRAVGRTHGGDPAAARGVRHLYPDEDDGKEFCSALGLGAETLLASVVSDMKAAGLLPTKKAEEPAAAAAAADDVKYPEVEGEMAVPVTMAGAHTHETPAAVRESPKAKKLDRGELLDRLRRVKQAFDDEGMGHTLEAGRLKAAIDVVKGGAFDSFEKAAKILRRLLLEIRTFDIAEFLELYVKTEEMSDALKGQSCWLFAGPTGAGKSTTIHYMAGSEMVIGDAGHIYPVRIVNPALSSLPSDAVKVGKCLSTSETRYIAGVQQDLSEVGLDLDDEDRHVMFVDSPGFEDAQGPELDLANGLGMVRALRKAKRVKLVIVFSKYSYGTRMLVIKKLAATLSGILVNYKEILREKAACLLTKATEGIYEERHMRKDFWDVFEKEREKDVINEAFKFLAERLSRKTKPMPAMCVWPLRPELRIGVLKAIATDCEWIEYPKGAFQEFINGDTLAKLREQMSIYKKSITALCRDLNPAKCESHLKNHQKDSCAK